jgi:5-methyltetrahydropteroyltriglutamate--homocysteine methyltransferase
MTVFSDDIGSFPLPAGADRRIIRATAGKIVRGEAGSGEITSFSDVVAGIMQKKIDSGIVRPAYPQVQDMIVGFFSLIESFYEKERPWVIERKFAVLPELAALEPAAKSFFEETKKPLELRVCVTGPLELYLKAAGSRVEGGLLMNLAESVSRFVENSLVDKKHLRTSAVSIDEPSLGINPNVIVERSDLIAALDAAAEKAKKLDVQIHLHSPSAAELVYETKHIKVVGIESAEDPRVLSEVSRDDLLSCGKYLRAGIARTNIGSLLADFRDKHGREASPVDVVQVLESSDVIAKRLQHAYELFGDRLLYAGPDCGLGGWPNQDSAYQLLKNCAGAVTEFNKKNI